jgi:hypothetical protein
MCQPFLAGVEQLVDEIFFDADSSLVSMCLRNLSGQTPVDRGRMLHISPASRPMIVESAIAVAVAIRCG